MLTICLHETFHLSEVFKYYFYLKFPVGIYAKNYCLTNFLNIKLCS